MKDELRTPAVAEAMAGKEEERVRPAKHIFARYPARRGCSAHQYQKLIVENRGGVRRETPRTATGTVALLNHALAMPSQSQSKCVKPVLLLKPAVRIAHNTMTMNDLQNKQH